MTVARCFQSLGLPDTVLQPSGEPSPGLWSLCARPPGLPVDLTFCPLPAASPPHPTLIPPLLIALHMWPGLSAISLCCSSLGFLILNWPWEPILLFAILDFACCLSYSFYKMLPSLLGTRCCTGSGHVRTGALVIHGKRGLRWGVNPWSWWRAHFPSRGHSVEWTKYNDLAW